MSDVYTVTDETMTALADAIRKKNGSTDTYTVSEMVEEIANIETCGDIANLMWHQCPELPRTFVEKITYDPDDYTVSSIADYAPEIAAVSNYKPIGQTVGEKTFYNEEPNTATPFVSGAVAGTLTPLDKVRYINTPFAPNVRDLGGWECDGGTVKYGLLFRGGEPTADDRAVLVDELGIRHDLNLRGSSEATWDASPLGDDVYFTKADAYNWYSLANAEAWKVNLRCIFDAVTHNEPVFFHCAAGADRTATLACVLEGLLGMSQSDIDKDYELTCFYSGTSTDDVARRRNESEWQRLIEAINAKEGDTFRDKCVTFAAELGFTADEINAYRAVMIDGTPETVTPDIDNYAITTTLSDGVNTDNEETDIAKYQPYTANITVATGYAIKSVTVTMADVDITSAVFSGTKTNFCHNVMNNLIGCISNNNKTGVVNKQGYGATITADSGYTLDNAAVSITMGGADVSNYYSDGVIAIPSVTGDLVINIEAVESASEETYINKMVVQSLNKRISGTDIVDCYGVFVTEPIEVDLSSPCPVILKNFEPLMSMCTNSVTEIYANSKVALLDSDESILATWYFGKYSGANVWYTYTEDDDIIGDLSSILDNTPTAGSLPSISDVKYVMFSPQLKEANEKLTTDDLTGLEIQMLE